MFDRSGGFTGISPNHLAIARQRGVHGVWVEGVPQQITHELKIWVAATHVAPIRIPGYWFQKGFTTNVTSAPLPMEKVVYMLHGGSYVMLSAYAETSIVRGLLEHVPRIHRDIKPANLLWIKLQSIC